MEEIQNVVETTENVETPSTEQKVEKTFTQTEFVNALEKEVARKTKGIPSKDELAEFRTWKESQKTEAEKKAEVLRENETLKKELKNIQVVANAGIDPKFTKFVSSEVSQMEGEFEENLKNYLENNPQYLFQKVETPKTTGISQNTTTQKSVEKAYLDEKYKNNPYYKG